MVAESKITTAAQRKTSKEKTYSDSDLQCFDNIKWEMDGLFRYLNECNSRKTELFKLSLTTLTIVATGIVSVFSVYANHKSEEFDYLFTAIFGILLFSIGAINVSIIKELVSIHASRLITYRQMNCLRQLMDSIRFKKHEGSYPKSVDELFDKNKSYWNIFGKHRKLPIENSALRKSERNFLASPDKFMYTVIAVISTILMLSPAIILFAKSELNFPIGILCGAFTTIFLVLVISEISRGINTLRAHLNDE